ncbi:hypothetical protein [Lichenibacterium ramalinae]|uniref:hypothetical protein n=1 Tax=Lichenibacterium ramalinae TaxID=2316527 RepID=UPI00100F9090|nr:hypothetical protein [Lichenibacterium ramalinae]
MAEIVPELVTDDGVPADEPEIATPSRSTPVLATTPPADRSMLWAVDPTIGTLLIVVGLTTDGVFKRLICYSDYSNQCGDVPVTEDVSCFEALV